MEDEDKVSYWNNFAGDRSRIININQRARAQS